MEQTHFDLVVIGGGPGGYGAALYAASAGLSVAVVERDKVGGTCLHRGCIPAKEFLETAAVVRAVKSAGEFGVVVEPKALDWNVVLQRKQQVIDRLFGGVSQLLKGRKVHVFAGTGTLGANRNVTVVGADGDRATITGDAVILASGSVPRVIPGFEDYSRRAEQPGGFVLPHPPRDTRTFVTPSGRGELAVSPIEVLHVPEGHLLLQTMRSHDQYNTTIYGLDERYRGVKGHRRVVFVNEVDLRRLSLAAGEWVDIHGLPDDGDGPGHRVVKRFLLVPYDIPAGCIASDCP